MKQNQNQMKLNKTPEPENMTPKRKKDIDTALKKVDKKYGEALKKLTK